MGTCFSSSDRDSFSSDAAPKANVISVNGALHQYPLPINASQVLGLQTTSPSSFFLCNSDDLYFDQYIPALDSNHLLHMGHIYFVLPLTRLEYPLTAREMAAMAVKASVALVDESKKNGQGRRKRKMQISPVSDVSEVFENEGGGKTKRFEKMESDVSVVGRSKSSKRMMSRKGKVAQKPFKATLSTIPEGFTAE